MEENVIRNKVIGAFKGFIRTHELKPFKGYLPYEDTDYYSPYGALFTSDEETLEIFYQVRAKNRVLDSVERLYPDQIDRRVTLKYFEESGNEWVKQGCDQNDQSQLERALLLLPMLLWYN